MGSGWSVKGKTSARDKTRPPDTSMIYYLMCCFKTARVPLPKLGLSASLVLDCPSAPVKTGALVRGLHE